MNTAKQNYINLEKLARISEELADKCFYLVFGGFALDGIAGKFSRVHKDIDLLFFRRDLAVVKSGLKQAGFDMAEVVHHKEQSLVYKIISRDEGKICTCHILDDALGNSFEITFYHFLRQRFPLYLLASQAVTLHSVTYPVPTKEFLYILKEQENALLNEIKKNNPEKYNKWKRRHKLVKRDLKLLKVIA